MCFLDVPARSMILSVSGVYLSSHELAFQAATKHSFTTKALQGFGRHLACYLFSLKQCFPNFLDNEDHWDDLKYFHGDSD